MNKGESAEIGWRERKRRETHKRILESAIALFGAGGYEATTLDAIVEASGISKSTFFHYFKSKEELLVAWQADVPELLRAAIAAEPAVDTPIEFISNVLVKLPTRLAPDRLNLIIMINRIIRCNEQLCTSNLAKFLQLEDTAFEGLCERWPAPEQRDGLRMVAMAAIGALRVAIDRFAAAEGRRPLLDIVEAAMMDLHENLCAGPRPAPLNIKSKT